MTDPSKHLEAPVGFLDLGMPQDAWDELEKMPPILRDTDAVLDLRIEIFQKLGKWESARILAESVAKRCPENPNWWPHWAYSLRREKSVEAARTVLQEAAVIHPTVPIIPYNLACYACVLGQIEAAKQLLETALKMYPHLRMTALNAPNLEAIFGETGL
jgi:tetratricopeptide (TPR) repeat protein